jgi:streptomycin 6-kinase
MVRRVSTENLTRPIWKRYFRFARDPLTMRRRGLHLRDAADAAGEAATMKSMELRIPSGLAASCRKTPKRAAWLGRLPDVLRNLEHRWSLTLDTPFDDEEVSCSYVAAVVRADETPAVLKIGMPHMEGEHEIQGLRFWDGDPTVRLLMADDDLGAMLLERCEPGTPLRALPECEQDVVISGLLRRLWRVPSAQHSFRPLSALAEYWSDETLAHIEQWPDTGLVREGLRLLTELPGTALTEFVLATDLHAGNVLRAERQPWLVIDPKPFVGDPAFDATQHLFNCSARLRSDPEGTIRSFADRLGVDHERVRLWTFARAAAEPRDDWSNGDLVALARAIGP